ncbi:prolyl oligopeptidase family serine peptidase [Luteimonas sp. e5]
MRLRSAVLSLALLAALPLAAHAERGFDVRDMLKLDRYSSPLLTADGSLLYAHRATDAKTLSGSTALWLRPADGGEPRRVTPADFRVSSPALSADGKSVYFLSAKSGSNQLYSMPLSGGAPKQLTALPVAVDGFVLSPDNRRVALALSVFPECKADIACSADRLKAQGERGTSGVLYESLFVRHWDTWKDGRMNRVFIADLGKAPARTGTLLAPEVQGDIPAKPFGDLSDLAWSPDGSQLALAIRPQTPQQPWSTNFDIWLVPADGSGNARNLTAANPAWDAGPVFSHDGKTLYYWAMKRPGFEADRHAAMAMDLASRQTREIAPDWDRSVNGLTLSADGKTLYATAQSMGERPLYAIDIASGEVTELVADGSVGAFDVREGRIAFARNSLKTGDQLFVANADGSGVTAASRSAGEMAPEVRFGDFEQFNFKGWRGNTVHGYVVKPWNWQPGKRYPVAFLIHGGPQGSFGNGWSYRWNPQTYAGAGYAVVMIDFHGSTGYGQAFTDAISGHWGDRPLEDLQKGWVAAQKQYDWLDGDRACALGASYGGYMTNWIAGNWFNRDGSAPFKCLVTHNGVFDTRSMGLVTEELWFTEWEFGGTVWEKPEAYERFNPARHVGKWKTPTLIVGGNLDFRVPIDQSISAFTALQRRGIDSQFLYFPDENHWVLKPNNSVQWHDTVNAWLKRHIGE